MFLLNPDFVMSVHDLIRTVVACSEESHCFVGVTSSIELHLQLLIVRLEPVPHSNSYSLEWTIGESTKFSEKYKLREVKIHSSSLRAQKVVTV